MISLKQLIHDRLVYQAQQSNYNKLRVIWGWGITSEDLPCITLVRLSDERHPFIGDIAQSGLDTSLNQQVLENGTYFVEQVEIGFWTTNGEVLENLYLWTRQALFNELTNFYLQGCGYVNFEGGREELDENAIKGQLLYTNRLMLTAWVPLFVNTEYDATIQQIDQNGSVSTPAPAPIGESILSSTVQVIDQTIT